VKYISGTTSKANAMNVIHLSEKQKVQSTGA